MINGLLQSIEDENSIPEHMLDFLVALIEDGNYFPINFLTNYELKTLNFNHYNATVNVLTPKFDNDSQSLEYDTSKARMLISNFLILR